MTAGYASAAEAMRACDRLVLLVSGAAPGSKRARRSLHEEAERIGLDDVPIDEVDVLREPSVAVRFRVFATPALVCVRNEEAADVLYGDLSDTEQLGRFLELARE